MSEKPTLHEIAAMPFPASMLAMRKYYNSAWGKFYEEGEVEARTFKVRVAYSWRESDERTYTIKAGSEEQAERIAEDMFDKDRTVEDGADVDHVEVSADDDA